MQSEQSNLSSSFVARAAGLIVVVVAGLAGVIGSGGGGGGGGSSAPPAEYLEITSANAADVAGIVIETVYSSLDLADAGAGNLSGGAAGEPALAVDRALLQPLRQQNLDASIQAVVGPVTEPCLVSGTITLSGDVADPFAISVGDRITAVFADCDDGDGAVADGRLELIIRALQGDPLTDVFLQRVDVKLTSFAIIEEGETTSADGNFELTLDSLDYPLVQTRLVSALLTVMAEGDTRTLTNFDETTETELTGLPYPFLVTASGTLASRVLDGKVDFATPVPVSGPLGDAPDTGEILITGLNGVTIRVVVLGPTNVELRLDLDGNGSVDEVQVATWADLGGTVAPGVTTGNAETLVREALAAANSYELTVRDAGAQFGTNGAFWNALNLITVPGTFGPVEPRCVLSGGSVMVTGELTVLDTFTPGDVFNGSYSNCYQWLDWLPTGPISILNGQLATTVSAYLGMGSVFDVAFDAVAAGFAGATGTLAATYSDPDPTNLSYTGVSPQMQLGGGTEARALHSVSVSASIISFVSPPRVTRSIDGDLYTAVVVGRYRLETLVPLVADGDDDRATGPDTGELLLSADNGTSVRVVAINKTTARLDLDLDGNGSTDQSTLVPWFDLQP